MVSINKKRIGALVIITILLVLGAVLWHRYVSRTPIAVINFRDSQYGQLLDAAEGEYVRLDRIEAEDLPDTELSDYTLTLIFGMGLRLDDVQAEKVRQSMKSGARVFVHASTSKDNEFSNLAGEDLKHIKAYLKNGGPKNLRRLFTYVRRAMDKKSLFTGSIEQAQEVPMDTLFHLGQEDYFTDVNAYQDYYEEKGLYKADRPRICLLTTLIGPRTSRRESLDDMIERLEKLELNVYPIAGFFKRLEYMKQIAPDLVVYFPHGRVQMMSKGNDVVDWLKERNIPLLCPINVHDPYEEWVSSQQGMVGGMLSQSIVMPELDGGIEPFVVSAEFPDERGLLTSKPIADRVDTFVKRIQNWLTLRSKSNRDKKVAIVYFKGPGRNALVASGMEVVESLLNVLRHLRDNGFTTGSLPKTVAEFEEMIQRQGPVLGPYAQGAFDDFIRNGEPELIRTENYLTWVRKQLDPALYAQVEARYGAAPGQYLSLQKDGQSYLALPRIQFENVVILPQLMPGIGDDSNKLVHGVKAAPPHPYIATYLWIRHAFGADALVHFGTHGSLEFTPWKQSALSQMDWPDALIGDLPHPYIYTINNIGEAVIAKRRSYATLVSHLTPPFMESELYGPLTNLVEAVHGYLHNQDEALRAEYVKDIRSGIINLNLDKDLGFEDFNDHPLDLEEMETLHDYLHTLAMEKVTRGTYVMGRSYTDEFARETAGLMALESVTYALVRLDRAHSNDHEHHGDHQHIGPHQHHGNHTHASNSQEPTHQHSEHDIDELFRPYAAKIVEDILSNKTTWRDYVSASDLARLDKWDKTHKSKPSDIPSGMGKDQELASAEKSTSNVKSSSHTLARKTNSHSSEHSHTHGGHSHASGNHKHEQGNQHHHKEHGHTHDVEGHSVKDGHSHVSGNHKHEHGSENHNTDHEHTHDVKGHSNEDGHSHDAHGGHTHNDEKHEHQKPTLQHSLSDDGPPHGLKCGCQQCTAWVAANSKNETDSKSESAVDPNDKAEQRREWIAEACQSDYSSVLFETTDMTSFTNAVEKWNLETTLNVKSILNFYSKHTDLSEDIGALPGKDNRAIAAILRLGRAPIERALKVVTKQQTSLEDEEQTYVEAIRTMRDVLQDVTLYKESLLSSTSSELDSLVRVLSGGYVAPSTGGDPLRNPKSVPTGRNLTAINMEKVPTPQAWKVGVKLADSVLQEKLAKTGNYPRKVAVTLWGGELIRTEGTQIAMIFHLLGVEPVRNARGTVHAVKLVPSEKLQRPRIDVVVQTSGQARDIAASRLFLIDEAVKMASAAEDPAKFPNHVKEGTIAAEQVMKEKGLSPLDAQNFATARIFGGVNGNYGTGIMGLVEAGDRWEDDQELTDQYLKNMGAIYTKEHWGHYEPGIFTAALQSTDTVVHSRSSNQWGPLSLDHVYEFMGGLNAVIRNVTGNDPDAMFSDLRNQYNPRIQGAKEAIWTESRTTLLNPKYITAMQQEGSSAAEQFAETFRNTYGWNVLKPEAIDNELWNGFYDVYVEDSLGLDMKAYFKDKNPYALQEMSAVMLETIRKGYWETTPEVIKNLAELHAELIRDHEPGCSGFVCDNAKLRDMIAQNLTPEVAQAYQQQIEQVRVGSRVDAVAGMQLKKEILTLEKIKNLVSQSLPTILMLLCLVGLFIAAVFIGARRHRG
jgi:cobaltochelatase CobN